MTHNSHLKHFMSKFEESMEAKPRDESCWPRRTWTGGGWVGSCRKNQSLVGGGTRTCSKCFGAAQCVDSFKVYVCPGALERGVAVL